MVEQEKAATATQQWGKHVSAAMNQHAATEELLATAFSVWLLPRVHSKDQWEKLVSQRSESVVNSLELHC
jgi:hypothetical protein